jgi:hypothetical protein
MRRQRGKTPHFVCARAEAWRDAGLGTDKKHAYVRAWSQDELETEAEPKHTHVDGPFASLRDMQHTKCPCGCGFKGVCEAQLARAQAHDDAIPF